MEGGYLSSTFRGVWARDTNCKLLEFDGISRQETKIPWKNEQIEKSEAWALGSLTLKGQ